VRSALEGLLSEKTEESLDHVQPRAVRRGEVQVESRMANEPSHHGGRLVGGKIVEDDVNLETLLD